VRILLLSAYDADSHRRWREGLVAALPEHDWTVETLPPRHFSWRIRGNPLALADQLQRSRPAGWDRLMATSMTDLATLRGLVPSLAAMPAILYFHEEAREPEYAASLLDRAAIIADNHFGRPMEFGCGCPGDPSICTCYDGRIIQGACEWLNAVVAIQQYSQARGPAASRA